MADWRRQKPSFQRGVWREPSKKPNHSVISSTVGPMCLDDKKSRDKKYFPGCDADKEAIFNFPFILNEDTVTFLQKHGKIMFIIRGPPSTGKATLSEMIVERYPTAIYCCADRYFHNSFSTQERSRENIAASHIYCQKKTETACLKNESPILVQNTHMRRWEMQKYLDLAAAHNYTVIMAITLYKYSMVTPEVLERNNTDGLSVCYFRNRLRQWEDVPPIIMGFFICPDDSLQLLSLLQTSLKALLDDGKFCRIFNMYDSDDLVDYFRARKMLFCLAGYSRDNEKMKNYYLSEKVQECYGKSYKIIVQGYIVSLSGITGVVNVEKDMKNLLLNEESDLKHISQIGISDCFSSLTCNDNLDQHLATDALNQESFSSGKTITLEPWMDEECINVTNCCLIHLAQKGDEICSVDVVRKQFYDSVAFLSDDECQLIELENDVKVCRLPANEWFIKAPEKIVMKTVFTGLFI